LKEEILIKKRNKVDERRRKWCVESVENDCCNRMIVNQNHIACQLLLRRDKFCFKNRDRDKNKNKDENRDKDRDRDRDKDRD
jgi:hypothetical protein